MHIYGFNIVTDKKSVCTSHNETTTVETSSSDDMEGVQLTKRKITKKHFQDFVTGE